MEVWWTTNVQERPAVIRLADLAAPGPNLSTNPGDLLLRLRPLRAPFRTAHAARPSPPLVRHHCHCQQGAGGVALFGVTLSEVLHVRNDLARRDPKY